jgi:hypothetical protein
MDNEQLRTTDEQQCYEPPKIDRVLTADELTREILYAGVPSGVVSPGD